MTDDKIDTSDSPPLSEEFFAKAKWLMPGDTMSTTLTSSETTYKAIVHPEAEGGYWAEVAGLPGCFTQGDTLDEINCNLAEAIACHLELDVHEV